MVAGFSTFLFAEICTNAALVWPDYEWSAAIVIGCSLSAIVGYMASTARNNSIVTGRVDDVSTPHEMQIWIRHQLQVAGGIRKVPPRADLPPAGSVSWVDDSDDAMLVPQASQFSVLEPGAGAFAPQAGSRKKGRRSRRTAKVAPGDYAQSLPLSARSRGSGGYGEVRQMGGTLLPTAEHHVGLGSPSSSTPIRTGGKH